MAGETVIKGEIVVETDPAGNPLESGPMYLQTANDSALLMLVEASMAAQMAVEQLAMQSRRAFEHALGKTVEVEGYRAGSVLYGARIVGPEDALPEVRPTIRLRRP